MKNSTIFSESCMAIDCLGYCSLSFLSLALLEEKKSSILFFTSQNYLLVKSELNHLKIHSKIYKNFQERVEFIFLKKSFSTIGKDFLKEFEAKVSAFSGEVIYFDRIDYFLDLQSLIAYKKILTQFKKIVEKYQKKIIYIYSSESLDHAFLEKAISINATKLDFFNREKKGKIMPALNALQDALLKEEQSPKKALTAFDDSKIQVMLMSDHDALKKLHYYIFSSASDVDYYTIDVLPEGEMELLKEMDILIFNKEDRDLKYHILEYIKKHKLSLKFFEITNQDYLRQKDLLTANLDGVDKLFKKDFLMEDFVMSIEMYLKSSFYSRRLLNLSDENEIIMMKKNRFEAKIDKLLEKKIFFSLFTYDYDADSDIESYNIQKIVREYDNIFINKRKKQIQFLILNTIPDFGKTLIENRIKNFSISLDFQEAHSAFDLVFD